MTTEQQTCIIIGASHGGANLANNVRREGWQGRILVIGNEDNMPYHRPPLSKALLMKEKTATEIELFKPAVYDKSNVEFMLGVNVNSIDRSAKQITLDNGEVLSYDKLGLCTGARVRKLEIPGADLNINLRRFSVDQAANRWINRVRSGFL